MKIKGLILLLVLAVCLGSAASAEESGWTNILLLGGDSRKEDGYERTDTMIILSVNRDECLMKMTSIMRDTYVEYKTGKPNKINAANVYGGPELAVRTVNRCFGTEIEDYLLINMTDMVAIIDLIGGVDVEITESEKNYINKTAAGTGYELGIEYSGAVSLEQAGEVHLNGLMAVAFMRNRSTDSDFGRVMRQQKVLIGMADRMQNMEIDELMEIVDEFLLHLETNMEDEALKELAYTGLATELEEIEQFRIPADGTYDAGMYKGIWVIRPDYDENAELLREFIYGEE